MGDIKFQMGVAPYMPEGSKIDPKKAKVHSLPQEYRDKDFNVKAFSVPGVHWKRLRLNGGIR